jgi:hypothetical protein
LGSHLSIFLATIKKTGRFKIKILWLGIDLINCHVNKVHPTQLASSSLDSPSGLSNVGE